MSFEIKKIYAHELEDFISSDLYKNFKNNPLPLSRAISLKHNIRVDETRPVLYLGLIGEEVASYRGVLQDKIFLSEKTANVVWTITSWTHPEHRKMGYSRLIFDEVSKDYNGAIFITNFGHMSVRLLSKREDLESFKPLDGHRFYYRLSLAEILPPKSDTFRKIKPLLKIADGIGNAFLDGKKLFAISLKNKRIENAELNEELTAFISKHNSNSLFKRNSEEFKWILQYPWVEEKSFQNDAQKKYHFTTSAKRFVQIPLVLKNEGKITGFLFYSIKNEMMKIHYIFTKVEKDMDEFCAHILHLVRSEKISYVLLTDEKLIQKLKLKKGYIYSKIWKKGYFIGKQLLHDFPEIHEKEIYMGDGDTIFT